MTNKKIRVAIIGCGKVAHLHAAAIQKSGNALLVAAQSRTKEKAEDFAQKYQIRAYTDIETMVRNEKVEAAVICTTHPVHVDSVVLLANLGVHCLVEKPLAACLEDCDKMIAACQENNTKLGVISQRRFYKPVQRIKEAIEGGKIGKPALATVALLGWRNKEYYDSDAWRGTWAMEGGGVLVNQAPHQLDVLLWLMGEIEELYGSWANLNHPYIEVEDTALAIIQFKNGALGNMVLSNSQKPGLFTNIHVHGTNGASVGVQIEKGAMFIAGVPSTPQPPKNDIWTIEGEENMLQQWENEDHELFASLPQPMEHFMQLQHQDFYEAILQNRSPLVTGADGRRVVELFTAIYRSQRDKRPIRFPLQPENDRNDFDGRGK
jgi:UDP-N-acetyl-2-amino-2-deoxyglucuronate dehydrogenase